MIDQNSRNRLRENTQARALANGLGAIGDSIKQAVGQKDYGPLLDLVFRQLRGLSAQLEELRSFDKKSLNTEEFQKSQALLESINQHMTVFNEIKAKMDAGQTIVFPKETQLSGSVAISNFGQLPALEIKNFPAPPKLPDQTTVKGQVDVGKIKELPPIEVANLNLGAEMVRISATILEMRDTIVKAILAGKNDKNAPVEILKPISLQGMTELLEGMEQLKDGFNILIKATQENKGFDDSRPMAVSIVEDRLPRPMPATNMSLNGLGGFLKTTAVTVTTALTPLPGEVLSNRRGVVVFNNGTRTMEIGGSTFTFGNGMPVAAGAYSIPIDAGSNLIVYGRVASGSVDCRVSETSDIATGR